MWEIETLTIPPSPPSIVCSGPADMMIFYSVSWCTTLRLVVLIAPPKNGLKWFEILHKDILGWQEPLCHLYLSSTCLRRSDFWHNSHSRPHYDLIDGQIGLRRNYIMSFDVGKLPWKFGTPKLVLSRGPMPSKFGFLKKFSLKTSLWPHRWLDWPA